jgi:hypothetical protein
MARAAIGLAISAVLVYAAGLVAWSQRGTCRDSDPIPECTNGTAQGLFYLSVPVALLLAAVAAALGLLAYVRHRRRSARHGALIATNKSSDSGCP